MSANENKFLTEYIKAQDSAEHHDTLIWTATGVACAANIALLIFAVREDTFLNYPITSTLLGLLGILLIICVWVLSDAFIALKKRKYDRCKELERKFGFKQHLNESKYYPRGRQRLVYNVCMFMFILLWAVLLTITWDRFHLMTAGSNSPIVSNRALPAGFYSVSNIQTLALVIVTFLYVIVTWRILEANRKAVRVMKDQLEASSRPYIVPSTFVVPGNSMICLKISNTGKMAARDVRLELNRDFYQYGETDDKYNLKNAHAFQNVIETFVPGMELLFYLGMGFQIFKDDTNLELTPPQFQITATYHYSEKEVSEKTIIDLEVYRKTSLPPQEATVKQLKEMVKAIRELKSK